MSIGRWAKRGRTFQGRAKAVWALAGSTQAVAEDYITTRLVLVGVSQERLSIGGVSQQRLQLSGTSQQRFVITGSDK